MLPCMSATYENVKIDRLNLEGYANLEHWVAELDKRIEGILLQRLVQIIQLWCTEFDRTEDDTRRDTVVLRDVTNKRRGDKRLRDEKVGLRLHTLSSAISRSHARRMWRVKSH